MVSPFDAAADWCGMPSREEARPRVLREAMASGLPVITSRTVGGAVDLIEDGVSGLLIESPVDTGTLAEKMASVMNQTELRKTLGCNAQLVADRYSWARGADLTMQTYKDFQGIL